MARRRRIVFVINSIGSGGAERVLDIVLRHAGDRRARYDLHLVLLDDLPEMRPFPALDARHCLDAGGGLVRSIWGLRRLLASLRPDLVVGFLIRANVAVAFSGGEWRRVLCERMHIGSHLTGRYRGVKLTILHRLLRAAYARATLILGVSQGVSDDLIATFGAPPARVRTINNPYEIDRIVVDGAKPPSIALPAIFHVAVGRLVAAKGFADLIAAYALSACDIPLVILGEGPERAALEQQAVAAGLRERIMFAGFVAEPFAIVARARALLSASYNEGFPNAIAEAMALGRPVLATDCPSGPGELLGGSAGPAGTVAEAPAGLLVGTGDVAALARGLAMLDDPALCGRLAEAGRRRIADFAAAPVAERYWRTFDDLLGPATDR